MKISVVTISFNQAKYLAQCIDSVLSQVGVLIEYIVVDPGSTDGSREIIESYGSNIIKIFGPDKGPADGLNKGFSIASGDILYFINSDDFLLPGALKLVTQLVIENPQVDLFLGAGMRVDGEGKCLKYHFPSYPSKYLVAAGAVTLFQQGMFFKREIFERVGGFNPINKTSWDGELFLDFILQDIKIIRTFNLIAAFRVYPESITGSQRYNNEYLKDRDRNSLRVIRVPPMLSVFYVILCRVIKLLDLKYSLRVFINKIRLK